MLDHLAGPAADLLGDPVRDLRDGVQLQVQVLAARARQMQRAGVPNARLDPSATARDFVLAPADRRLLERAMDQLHLSARALHRIQRVARTLADLEGSDAIARHHVAEAIGYRLLDRGHGAPPPR